MDLNFPFMLSKLHLLLLRVELHPVPLLTCSSSILEAFTGVVL